MTCTSPNNTLAIPVPTKGLEHTGEYGRVMLMSVEGQEEQKQSEKDKKSRIERIKNDRYYSMMPPN